MAAEHRLLFVIGTRPEAIKLAPLVLAFADVPGWDVRVCVTAQHRQMLDRTLAFFHITPHYDLDLMRPDQHIADLTANVVRAMGPVLDDHRPDLVIVQGDTTTVFAAALAAFYRKIRVAHVEAGLRSGDRYSPFPEEMNRLLTTRLTDLHLAPTPQAAHNLQAEGITGNVHVTGNTVIDALQLALRLVKNDDATYRRAFPFLEQGRRTVLVTCHRRESFGEPFRGICGALLTLVERVPDIAIVYPVHPNPNVQEVAHALLKHPRIHLIAPLDYPYLVWLMDRSHLVLTDSGGIQEEAPSLGKPVLVMRDVTERMEGVTAGTARLVGTDPGVIVREARLLLEDDQAYQRMAKAVNPYGDGTSSLQIRTLVQDFLNAG